MSHLVPVFVYGTLRPGERLHHLLAADVEGWLPDVAVADHALHFERSFGVYPVMVPAPGATTRGDLLVVRDGWHLRRVVAMETGSGYTAEVLPVLTGDRPVKALCFVYSGTPGRPVPGGDWRRRLGSHNRG
ncbi:MAG: gamma-glutamylcyclotransferase family protein [Actinomycetota bacterium]